MTTRPPASNGSMMAPTRPSASASEASDITEMLSALLDGEHRTT